jgi:hypothetical protein
VSNASDATAVGAAMPAGFFGHGSPMNTPRTEPLHGRRRTRLGRLGDVAQQARAVFHARRGDLHRAYRPRQENRLGALGLVVNALALFNTRYADRALAHLQRLGNQVDDGDIERLSPLTHHHVNVHGRYTFSVPEVVRDGELRPLHSPTI